MKYFLSIILFCQSWVLAAQQVWFVNLAATGTNNGTNWQNAFNDLQTALTAAGYGDQIWIAKGTYYPTSDGNRDISFVLPVGVSLYGGFTGAESTLTQRNIQANPTVLSGDINISGIQTDNSYHVVTIYGGDSLTVLDGFTITSGEAKAAGINQYGGGLLIVADATHQVATPLIRQCRFEKNRANSGGGIACLGSDNYACCPEIQSCIFIRNRGEEYGGGVYKIGKNPDKSPFCILKSNFSDNYCFQNGGGVAVVNPSGTIRLQGCEFIRDSTRVEAGGVYFETGNHNVNYDIDSCNFTANYSFIGTAGLYQIYTGFSDDTVEIIIQKSLFFLNHTWTDVGGGGGAFYSAALSGVKLHRVHIKKSVFESNFSQNSGSGIKIEGHNGVFTDVNVDRCFFLGNKVGASSVAGAFYYRAYSSLPAKNRNTITNSVFLYNDGAIASLAGNPGTTDTRVVNCSFYRNGEIPFIKYWDPDFDGVNYYMNMQILNSVIWEPQVEGVHRLFYNNDPVNFNVNDYLIEHSLVHLNDCTYNGVNPCGEGMAYEQWPDFVDTIGGSNALELYKCSPAHNTGSTLVADTFGLVSDYSGKPRIVADTVDMGAYEIQGPCISGISDLPSSKKSIVIHPLQNPISSGRDIQCELIVTFSGSYLLRLIRSDGKIIEQVSNSFPAYIPTNITFPGRKIFPGIYFITATDEKGQTEIQKVIVH